MKKTILTIILAISFIFVVTVNGQTRTSFGIKLNGDLSTVKVSNLKNETASFKPGISAGGFAKISFGPYFVFQPELLVSYMEKRVKRASEKVRFKYASVEIPLYAMGQFDAGRGKLFIGAGPHIGYGLSIDSKVEKLPCWEEGANKVERKNWYMGGGVIAGYEFAMGLSLHAGYKLSYALHNKNKTSATDTQTLSLGVGYCF